ncbi:MAG: Hsp20 family protein [Candidatus Angelobacter sp.]
MKGHVSPKPKKVPMGFVPTSLTQFCERSDRITKQLAKRAFQLFEERGCENGHDLDDWFKAEAELIAPIPIKVKETAREIRIEAEVRGFNDDEVAFNLEKNQVSIQGIKQTNSNDATQSKSEIRMIYGSISLPSEVVPQKAHATLKNGILEIIAPRSATEIAKAIAVSAA